MAADGVSKANGSRTAIVAFGCPCDFNAPPTHGSCKGMVGMRITKGHFEGTRLDGLGFSQQLSIFRERSMRAMGRCSRSSMSGPAPEQRQALFNIMSGKNSAEGTLFHIMSLIVTRIHDPMFVPISSHSTGTGRVARLVARGVLETEVEPIKSPVTAPRIEFKL